MHMLTPKPSSYYTGLDISSFAYPLYLKKAQLEKPCLYNVKYDKNDLANLFAPEFDEAIRLAKESRSKLCAPEFLKLFEINELNAQLQDKSIAINELKKLTERMKGKSVDTNFGKPSILGKLPSQLIRNQPVVRQPTVFKSERPSFSKNWCASQVVEKNDFTKPVTPHSWPQVRQSTFAKPHHVNSLGPSRYSSNPVSKSTPKESVGSNDMVHNYYLDKAKKNAQI
ncbi:hypothetical protein Tco_0915897 [Tanacetum coccineum]